MAVRSDRDALRERAGEQEQRLDDASDEIRRLVASLQVRAEEVLGSDTDIVEQASSDERSKDSIGGNRTSAVVADIASLPTP